MSDTILYADPDAAAREDVVEELLTALADLDPNVDAISSLDSAEAVLDDRTVGCVVTAYELHDGTGLELIERVQARQPDAGAVIFTDLDHEAIDTTGLESTVAPLLDRELPSATSRLADIVRETITERRQVSYPIPEDEDARIRALGSYDLDSDRLQQSLEHVAGVAAAHFERANAEVNLLERTRQRSIACHGPDTATGTAPRADSICTFTILNAEATMAVPDVGADPRFERIARLAEQEIRAYIGAPLVTRSGLAIGTLCVWFDEPRTFDDADREFLQRLATVAMDHVERERSSEDEAMVAGGAAGGDQ